MNHKYKIGWKVVTENYTSISVTPLTVCYRSKSWITSKVEGTPLFLFKTKKDAEIFMRGQLFGGWLKLLKVKYEKWEGAEWKKDPPLIPKISFVDTKEIIGFWQGKKIPGCYGFNPYRIIPEGTVLAKAIYILKEYK